MDFESDPNHYELKVHYFGYPSMADRDKFYGRNLESGLIDFTSHGFIDRQPSVLGSGPVISDGDGYSNTEGFGKRIPQRVYILENIALAGYDFGIYKRR